MALFNFGKDKREDGGLDLVLAYLEDLQRVRAQVSVLDSKKKEASGVISTLDEGASQVSLQLLGPLVGASKGDKVELVFFSDGTRIGGTCRVAEVRGNNLVLELPEGLEIRERRNEPRAKLHAKEGASITALTGLFDGIGMTGNLENVSETGARMRVDKAMGIKGEKKLSISQALVSPGQAFMVVKVNGVPKCPPTLELAGKAVYVEQASGGLFIGIKFDKPQSPLGRFVSARGGAVPRTVPPKSRRKNRMAVEPEEKPAPVATPEPAPAPPTQAVAPVPSAPVPEAVAPNPVAPVEADGEESKPVRTPPSPVLRLKKRSRAAVVYSSLAKVESLREVLEEDGYGRILMATSQQEVIEHMAQPNLAFLFIDLDDSILDGLKFVGELRQQFPQAPPIVLAAHEVSRAVVMAAHRAGAHHLIVKPYALDDEFLGGLEAML